MGGENGSPEQLQSEITLLRSRIAELEGLQADSAQREEILVLNETNFHRAQELAQLGIYEMKAPFNSENIRWSDETFRIIGRDRSQGEPSADEYLQHIVHPQDRAMVAYHFEESLRGSPFDLDYRIELLDGSIRHVHSIGEILRDEDGNVTGMNGILIDITERRQREQTLRQNEERARESQKFEAIGQLAGGISHDFNNLLTGIIGFTELAMIRVPPGSPESDFLEQASIALERSRQLVRQLLTFSRHEVTSPRVISLNHVIYGVEELLRRVIPESIEIITLPAPDLWLTRVDPGQIEQVLVNLAVNARDAMPEGGKLIIGTLNASLEEGHSTPVSDISAGEYVMLTVSDDGIGMTEEVKAHAFEPYFTTKEVGQGSGLGLSTCYGIVSQSGGHILIESEGDKGSTVTVYLPRAEGEASASSLRTIDGYLPTGIETVLVVEDEPTVLRMVAHVLREQGYTVLEAADGLDALKISQEHGDQPIHLLLSDVVMPLLHGGELLQEIRKLRPNIKVLFISGYNDDTVLRMITLADDVGFLQKPFSPTSLTRRLREVLDG